MRKKDFMVFVKSQHVRIGVTKDQYIPFISKAYFSAEMLHISFEYQVSQV